MALRLAWHFYQFSWQSALFFACSYEQQNEARWDKKHIDPFSYSFKLVKQQNLSSYFTGQWGNGFNQKSFVKSQWQPPLISHLLGWKWTEINYFIPSFPTARTPRHLFMMVSSGTQTNICWLPVRVREEFKSCFFPFIASTALSFDSYPDSRRLIAAEIESESRFSHWIRRSRLAFKMMCRCLQIWQERSWAETRQIFVLFPFPSNVKHTF